MPAKLTPFPSPGPGISKSAEIPKTWNVLPFPTAGTTPEAASAPAPLPSLPDSSATQTQEFPKSWPSPLSVLPSAKSGIPDSSPAPVEIPEISKTPTTPETAASPLLSAAPKAQASAPDFTDDDLREAFGPIVEDAVRKAVYAKENGIDTYLEPMLRATIRRALAEYAPSSRPFEAPGAFDRFVWHVQALFTSRTYEDIFFEKTRRFQVEEVFLLDGSSLALVSFASCDPARHASVRRVFNTVQRIGLQLRGEDGEIRPAFELPEHRHVISRQGRHVILVALIRGTPGELVLADLDFSLRRIEDQFREQFQEEGSALLYAVQPFLEDCLLIQSPASAA
jgi:hypothetical protein